MIDKNLNSASNQSNYRGYGLDVHRIVFPVITTIIILFISITLIFPEIAGNAFTEFRLWLTSRFDWVFIITTNILLLFCLILTITPAGKIKLGGQDSQPEFPDSVGFRCYLLLDWVSVLCFLVFMSL